MAEASPVGGDGPALEDQGEIDAEGLVALASLLLVTAAIGFFHVVENLADDVVVQGGDEGMAVIVEGLLSLASDPQGFLGPTAEEFVVSLEAAKERLVDESHPGNDVAEAANHAAEPSEALPVAGVVEGSALAELATEGLAQSLVKDLTGDGVREEGSGVEPVPVEVPLGDGDLGLAPGDVEAGATEHPPQVEPGVPGFGEDLFGEDQLAVGAVEIAGDHEEVCLKEGDQGSQAPVLASAVAESPQGAGGLLEAASVEIDLGPDQGEADSQELRFLTPPVEGSESGVDMFPGVVEATVVAGPEGGGLQVTSLDGAA